MLGWIAVLISGVYASYAVVVRPLESKVETLFSITAALLQLAVAVLSLGRIVDLILALT